MREFREVAGQNSSCAAVAAWWGASGRSATARGDASPARLLPLLTSVNFIFFISLPTRFSELLSSQSVPSVSLGLVTSQSPGTHSVTARCPLLLLTARVSIRALPGVLRSDEKRVRSPTAGS